MTLRDLLVISGLCLLTEDADEAVRLALAEEVVHLFGEDAFERLDAIEASNEESEEVMLQILRSLAVDQELLDVKAGIPARDAEIAALRKQVETLQAQPVDRSPEMQGTPVDESPNLQSQKQPVSGADGFDAWIKREYPWLGAIGNGVAIAREAWGAALAQQDADKVDAERYRAWRDAAVTNSTPFVRAMRDTLPPEAREGKPRWPTAAEWDAAIDAARTENSNA